DLLLELGHVLAALVRDLAEALGVLALFFELRFDPGQLLAGRLHVARGGLRDGLGIREGRAQLLELAFARRRRRAQNLDLLGLSRQRRADVLEVGGCRLGPLVALRERLADLPHGLPGVFELALAR